MEKTTLTSVSGVIAAIVASLCCIGPIVLALVGVGSIATFSVFETYRPYLIGLTIVLLGIAFFLTYRRREVKCDDGTCKVESASVWNKMGVWIATFIAAGAIAFPYFGFTMSHTLMESLNTGLNSEEDVSFLNVPLVCNAAPNIGCGSRAKFIMLDLMKGAAVKEAWLNRKGTVMAVVWNETKDVASRQTVLKSILSRHELPIELVNEEERSTLLKDFREKDKWYKGSDVDALSIEEAGVIADRVVAALNRHVKFRKEGDKQVLREEIKGIFQRRFLSLTSFSELTESSQHDAQEEAYAAAEKYIGKENMPSPQVIIKEYEVLRENDECCSKETTEKNGDACCPPQKKGTKR